MYTETTWEAAKIHRMAKLRNVHHITQGSVIWQDSNCASLHTQSISAHYTITHSYLSKQKPQIHTLQIYTSCLIRAPLIGLVGLKSQTRFRCEFNVMAKLSYTLPFLELLIIYCQVVKIVAPDKNYCTSDNTGHDWANGRRREGVILLQQIASHRCFLLVHIIQFIAQMSQSSSGIS